MWGDSIRSWVFPCSPGSPLTETDPPTLAPQVLGFTAQHTRSGCCYFFLWLLIEQLFKKPLLLAELCPTCQVLGQQDTVLALRSPSLQ